MITINELKQEKEKLNLLKQYITTCNGNSIETLVILKRLKELNKEAKTLSFKEFMAEAKAIRNLATLNITRR
jgi:hypothetical protein